MLKNTFGQNLTTDLNEFNQTNKNIALQIVSGREGISLAKADCLVMFNIQFSAVSYFQSRDRLTTKDRKENNVFWIFSNGGIESSIYKTVMNKTDYTNSIFKKEYNINEKIFKTYKDVRE
jgi:archaellin